MDFIYGCPICKGVTETWHHDRSPGYCRQYIPSFHISVVKRSIIQHSQDIILRNASKRHTISRLTLLGHTQTHWLFEHVFYSNILQLTVISNSFSKHLTESFKITDDPDSKVHGANMGPIWVLSAPGGSHVGPINLAIRGDPARLCDAWRVKSWFLIPIALNNRAHLKLERRNGSRSAKQNITTKNSKYPDW